MILIGSVIDYLIEICGRVVLILPVILLVPILLIESVLQVGAPQTTAFVDLIVIAVVTACRILRNIMNAAEHQDSLDQSCSFKHHERDVLEI